MAFRLTIDRITPDTPDWNCKVQIVDMGRERESPEKKIRFQNLILEDEENQQVRATIFGSDIGHYAGRLKLWTTYIVSSARVKIPSGGYGRLLHRFYCVLYKETIVECVERNADGDQLLPTPVNLSVTSFEEIARMVPSKEVEIDILAVVVRCGLPRKREFMLTMWEDLNEIEGSLLQAVRDSDSDFSVILGRNIGITDFQGFSLQTRHNSTVLIDPPYLRAQQLIQWAKENKTALQKYGTGSYAVRSNSLAIVPASAQVVPLSDISAQSPNGVFYVEAEICVSNLYQKFCVLECSGCKQKKRTREAREFHCAKCNKLTTLIPRCSFQVDLVDGTGSVTVYVSGDIGERMLLMKAAKIFEITCTKNLLLPVDEALEALSNKLFRIQLRKLSWTVSYTGQPALTVVSYVEKGSVFSSNILEPIAKKAKSEPTGEEVAVKSNLLSGSSNSGSHIQPSTPAKKMTSCKQARLEVFVVLIFWCTN